MATVKQYNSNIIIQSTGISSNITLDAERVTIPGNLTVLGTTTSIETTNTTIKDKTIVLNDGEAGSGVGPSSIGTAGILIDRGSLANVELRWDEQVTKWQVGTVGGAYANILTGTTSGISNVQADTGPTLGGNLFTAGFGLGATSTNTYFGGNLQMINTDSIPSLQANSTVVYATTPAAGTSGVYVVNGSAANEELVTKRRAFGFSLIL